MKEHMFGNVMASNSTMNFVIYKNAMKTHRIIMFDKIIFSNSNLVVEKLLFEIPNIK